MRTYRKLDELNRLAKFADIDFPESQKKAAEAYPFLANSYYLGLIGGDLRNDPIFKQCFPDGRELRREKGLSADPLAEESQMPVQNLIHRYRDRVVLLVTNRCAVHCRFCFRKRKWRSDNSESDISDANLREACRYISSDKKIREVIVSGGDPLMLSTPRLEKILHAVAKIKGIGTVRVGTRIPAVFPSRVDEPLVNMLSKVRSLWIMTHFNHPAELTADSEKACLSLVNKGIPLLNQTVLLRGVNDNAGTLGELFRGLARMKVKPHYLFHADPVEGSAHFRTGIKKGLALMRELRSSLSSVCTPVFALDLPGGGGKVPLQAEYRRGGGYESLNGKAVPYF